MLAAKAAALIAFLALFLVGTNPVWNTASAGRQRVAFLRQLFAHAAAVGLAGVFASSSFSRSAEYSFACLTGPAFAWPRTLVQMLVLMALVLLMLQYLQSWGLDERFILGTAGAGAVYATALVS